MHLPLFTSALALGWLQRSVRPLIRARWAPVLLAAACVVTAPAVAAPERLQPGDREALRLLGSSFRLRFYDADRSPGSPGALNVERLVGLLTDPHRDVALGAAFDLRQRWGGDQPFDQGMEALGRAFQDSSDTAMKSLLWSFLSDSYFPDLTPPARTAAIRSLRQVLVDTALFEAADETAVAAVRGMVHMGLGLPEVQALLKRLAGSSGRAMDLRRVAAWGDAISPGERPAAELAALRTRLLDAAEDPVLRRYAARALAGQRNLQAIDALLECLPTAAPGVKSSCRLALAWLLKAEPPLEPRTLSQLHARLADRLAAPPAGAPAGAITAAPQDAATLAQVLVLADDSRMPPATALPLALRWLSHENLAVAALAGGWLWRIAYEGEPLVVLEAVADWMDRHPAGHRCRPLVSGVLANVLDRLPETQLRNLPERLWQPARHAALDLQQQLTRGAALSNIETDALDDTDAQAWEGGPSHIQMPAVEGPAGHSPAPRSAPARSTQPLLNSRAAWQEWTLPRAERVRSGPMQEAGTGRLAFGIDADWHERFSGRLDRALAQAGDTLAARTRKLARDNPWVAGGVAVLGTVMLLGHLACGLYHLASRRPWRLAHVGVQLRRLGGRRSQVSILGLQVRLQPLLAAVLGLWWCQLRPKVLDAWVARHHAAMRDRFEAMPTVASRRQVLDRPVEIDGRRSAGLPDAGELRRLLGLASAADDGIAQVLVIHGDGGSGKTTLACQIAARAWHAQPAERLMPAHLILPVLVERDWVDAPMEPAVLAARLVERVREELSIMAGGRVPIDTPLVEALMRERRLLVILDHLSEMGDASRAILRQMGRPDFVAPLLVVTSRRREEIRDAHHLQTPLLRGEAAAAEYYWHFLRAEHEARHGDALSDERYRRAEQCLRQLSAIIRERQVSILLVRLYAAYAVTTLDDATAPGPGQAPRSVPQVMQWHVQHAVQDAELAAGAVRVDTFADAKVVAWACLQGHWVPGKAAKRGLLGDLAAVATQPPPGERLEWLRTKANLVRQDFGDTDEVAFVLDPLAEYMAGFHLVDDFRTPGSPLLRQHGASIAALDAASHGFRAAVDDCFADKLGLSLVEALARLGSAPAASAPVN